MMGDFDSGLPEILFLHVRAVNEEFSHIHPSLRARINVRKLQLEGFHFLSEALLHI
jgi:hypothetical protein